MRTIFALFIICFVPVTVFSIPLAGTYTIGGTTPDYATMSAAASALNINGVNGAVTFNIRTGIYNESITINNIAGASSINHITFQSESGNRDSVTIIYTNQPVVLNASRYITFKNMTISATAKIANTNKTFVFQNGCNTDSIINCVLTAPIAPWTDYTFVIHASTGTNDNIVVMNSHIDGAGFGYEVEGGGTNNGPFLINNEWTNQTYMAIDLMDCKNVLVKGNCITSECVTTPQYSGATTGSRFGIILWNGCHNVQILENKIYGSIQQGMYIPTIGGTQFLIANNFINANIGVYGLHTQNYTFLNNSFNTKSYCVSLGSNCSNNAFKNNIFYSNGGSTLLDLQSANQIIASDFNDFYTTGALSTLYPNLSAWKAGTGFDANSINVLPPYSSTSNLHLTDFSGLQFGTPLNNVTTDIDGNIRSAVNPAIGADDAGPANNQCCGCSVPQVAVLFKAVPDANICLGETVTFNDQSTNSPTSWNWTFTGGTPGTSTTKNPAVTYHAAGNFDVKLVITTASGKDSLTKTSYINVSPVPDAGSVTANPSSICSGNSSQLSVTGSSGTIQWQSSGDGVSFSDLSGTSSTYVTPNITESTYFRVKATTACGIDSSNEVMVDVTPQSVAGVISALRDTVCSGTPDNLSVTGSSGAIQWQSSVSFNNFADIQNANSASLIDLPSQTTYYRVIAGSGACNDTSASFKVEVKPSPVAAFNYSSNSLQVDFDSNGSSGDITIYSWDFGDDSTSNLLNPVHSYQSEGTYHACLTVYNGSNCSFTICKDITVISTGTTDNLQQNDDFKVSPNPVSNFLFINENKDSKIEVIEIYNELGQLMLSEIPDSISNPFLMNVSVLSEGVYFLKIKTQSAVLFQKIIKQ